MKPNCHACKWHYVSQWANTQYCRNPNATEFDRVFGDQSVVIQSSYSEKRNEQLLNDCDKFGWFIKRKFLGLF